jgi:DNA-binding MurR/RpiR family transcriptional regulator
MIATRSVVFSGQAERVARLALEKPEAIAFGTLQSVATECSVGRTTVFRVAQRVGFVGFIDFQLLFERHLRLRQGWS